MPKRRITSVDVAEAAGVSQATVSHVFNNTQGRPISARTRARVLAAADRLHYQPNLSAQALSKGYSNEIVSLLPEHVESSLVVLAISAVQDRAIQLGYTPSIYLKKGGTLVEWPATWRSIMARRPAGVIGGVSLMTRDLVQQSKRAGMRACVAIGLEPIDWAPTIVFPFEELIRRVGLYLLGRGHRKVAFVSPRVASRPQLDGLAIWRRTLATTLESAGAELIEIQMEPTLEDAQRVVDRLRQSPHAPTAIYGFEDDYCFLLLKVLAERGLRVPQDIAVVGTGNSPFCDLSHPALTSARTDVATAWGQAVDIADALIHGRKPAAGLFVLPPPQVIVRESC